MQLYTYTSKMLYIVNLLFLFQERVNLRLNPKLNQVAIEDMPQPRFMDITEIKPANNQDEVIQLVSFYFLVLCLFILYFIFFFSVSLLF